MVGLQICCRLVAPSHALASASRKSAVASTDVATPTAPSPQATGMRAPQTAATRGCVTTADSTNLPRLRVSSPPRASNRRPKSLRGSGRMPRTAHYANELHARPLTRALRHLDGELALQRVGRPSHHLARATQKQWSPASSKASYARRSRIKRNSLLQTQHCAAVPPARGSGGEMGSTWSEDTMCEA